MVCRVGQQRTPMQPESKSHTAFSSTKRYNRLLRTNGIHPKGGPLAPPVIKRANKRSAEATVKAAEAKRRKIEGEHTDAAADDQEDVKPIITKLETDADVFIKQECYNDLSQLTNHYSFSPYEGRYLGRNSPARSSQSSNLPRKSYVADPNCTSTKFWQSFSQTDTPTTTVDHPQVRTSAPQPNEEICSKAWVQTDTKRDTGSWPSQDISAAPHRFCDWTFKGSGEYELFMPPIRQRSLGPPSLPAYKGHSVEIVPSDALSSSSQSHGHTSASVYHMGQAARQPEIIVID